MAARALPGGAVLRPAKLRDVPGIHARIVDLAVYEREPDAVTGTQEMLRDVLFGPDPRVHCHVVVRGEDVLGIAIWFLSYSTWTGTLGIHLEDLFVLESERGHGYGKAFLAELASICVRRGYARFEWSVLDWNEPAIEFYRSIGAEALDEWTGYRVTGDALAALAVES